MDVLPLSFHADTHHSVGSDRRRGNVAEKYSKKSGEMSRSSVRERDMVMLSHIATYISYKSNINVYKLDIIYI